MGYERLNFARVKIQGIKCLCPMIILNNSINKQKTELLLKNNELYRFVFLLAILFAFVKCQFYFRFCDKPFN